MKKQILLLALFFIIAYICALGVRPLIIPDETRYAEISREMIFSGDWSVPRLNGLLYFEKPVFGYWINALSITAFGYNPFAARLPSALAAGITALLLYFAAIRFSGDKKVAVLAMAVQLTFQLSFFVGVFNVLDSMLTASLTGALLFFYCAWKEQKTLNKNVYLAIFGIFCGISFLIKGFLAFGIPAAVIGPFLLWERRWKDLFTLPWVPFAVAVAVALPWSLGIHFSDGDYWNYFFWHEHIKRFFASEGGQHPEPFFYYIPVILGGALPWTFLFPAAFRGYVRGDAAKSLIRYFLCWFCVPVLLFSLSSGKLATYVLPCFPALAFLTAYGLVNFFRKPSVRRAYFDIGAYIPAYIMFSAAVALLFNFFTGIPEPLYAPGEHLKWFLSVFSLIFWGMLLFFSARDKMPARKLFYFIAGPVVFMFSSHFITPQRVLERKAPRDFLRKHHAEVPADAAIVTYKNMLRAVCWYYGRTDCFLFLQPGEFSYGLNREGNKRFIKDSAGLAEFIEENRRKRRVVLLLRTKIFNKDCQGIPEPDFTDTSGEFTIAVYTKTSEGTLN